MKGSDKLKWKDGRFSWAEFLLFVAELNLVTHTKASYIIHHNHRQPLIVTDPHFTYLQINMQAPV
jgi:hypothetical protein